MTKDSRSLEKAKSQDSRRQWMRDYRPWLLEESQQARLRVVTVAVSD
jgi:hypothetical protein